MPALSIVLDVEARGFRAMRDLDGHNDPRLIHMGEDARIELGALDAGMQSGAPSIAFCFDLPNGQVVLAESSLALLLTAADLLKARYGDPRA
jgi:hypothetical protein